MRLTNRPWIFLLFMGIFLWSCERIQQPKPKALLRLQFPEPQYTTAPDSYPFEFEYNDWVELKGKNTKAPYCIIPT